VVMIVVIQWKATTG